MLVETFQPETDVRDYAKEICDRLLAEADRMKSANPRGWRDAMDSREELLVAEIVHELGGDAVCENGVAYCNFTRHPTDSLIANRRTRQRSHERELAVS